MLRLRDALLVVGQQMQETIHIALVHETAASRASMALALGVLVAEIVASAGRVAFEAVRRLAETLRRGPVGFQLGHDHSLTLLPEFARSCAPGRGSQYPLARGSRVSGCSRPTLRDHFF